MNDLFENVNFKEKISRQQNLGNYPACNEIKVNALEKCQVHNYLRTMDH